MDFRSKSTSHLVSSWIYHMKDIKSVFQNNALIDSYSIFNIDDFKIMFLKKP
jgi:hypothetical protein